MFVCWSKFLTGSWTLDWHFVALSHESFLLALKSVLYLKQNHSGSRHMLHLVYQDIFHQSRTEEASRFVSHIDPSVADEKMSALMSKCIYPGRVYSHCPVSLTPHPSAVMSPWSQRGMGESRQEAGWARVTIWLNSRHFISGTALGFGQMVLFHWAAREKEQDGDYTERQAVARPLGKMHQR